MRTRMAAFIVAVSLIMLTAGCWDSHEIDERLIVTFIGVDRTDSILALRGEYKSSAGQTGGSPDNSSTGGSKIITTEGYTLAEARNSLHRKSNYDTYLGALRCVVFSDNYAKKGINEYLSRLRSDRDYRKTITVITTNSEMEKLFDAKKLNTESVGFDIEHIIQTLSERGMIYNSTVADVLENVLVNNTGYLLDNVDIIGSEIKCTGYSVIKENKKIGMIEEKQTQGVNYILLDNAYGEHAVDFEDTRATLRLGIKQKKINVFYNNDNIVFDINIRLKGEIISFSTNIKLDKEKMKALEEKTSELVTKNITDAIKISQEKYSCDYLSLYKYFRAKYQSAFEKINWNEKYKDAKFNISIKVEVLPSNMINYE